MSSAALGDVELAIKDGGKEENGGNDPIIEHTMTLEEVLKRHSTNLKTGLKEDEVLQRQKSYGKNLLTPPERTPWYVKLAEHMFGGFAILLWIGAVLCFIVSTIRPDEPEHLTLGIVLAAVVTLTGIYAFYEDMKAEAVLEGFMKMVPKSCMVLRDGNWQEIAAEDVVPGDILKLNGKNGENVAADTYVVEAQGLKVDHSSLTGESEPQKRVAGVSSEKEAQRANNMCFFGTGAVAGEGHGVVVRIGDSTEMGDIAKKTLQEEAPVTLMTIELERFVYIISAIAVSIGVTFLVISLAMSYDVITSVVSCIGIIVANVPEGLLATVTIALTITAIHMADKKVLVKDVKTVETLGAVSVIASDKTGTLTQNRMTVRHAIYNSSGINAVAHGRTRSRVDVTSGNEESTKVIGSSDEFAAGIRPVNRLSGKVARTPGDFDKLEPDLQSLVRVAGLCNHATFKDPLNEKGEAIPGGVHTLPILNRPTHGDASESALLKFAHSHCNIDELRGSCKEVACVPFNSANKWMATVHRVVDAAGKFKEYQVLLKGAPERVIERCATHGANLPLTKQVTDDIYAANNEVATNGERVLAFAELSLKGVKDGFKFDTDDINKLNFKCDGLRFVGLLSLEDPPRQEVPAAVESCRSAGIRVIMVTGDQPLTGRSIAAQVGILKDPKAQIYDCSLANRHDENMRGVVVTGPELDKFNDKDWEYVLSREDVVFARTLPAQKQLIVKKLQGTADLEDGEEAKGAVVAVTGDGVNDAPALKSAQVGIAMGIAGMQVAKDAADLILMDDNFASIVNGVKEGRLIFANLKKSIAYTLTSNIPEILPFLMLITLRIPLGLTTIMILCIDLGTDMLPAIAFAYEVPEANIMEEPPRNRFLEKLVTFQLVSWSYLQIGIIQAFAAFTAFFYIFEVHGFTSIGMLNQQGMDGTEFVENTAYDDCIDVGGTPNACRISEGCEYRYDTGDKNGECAYVEDRIDILKEAQTCFLASIVVCQIGCGLAAKTRTNSLFTQGMVNNVQNYGIFQEVLLIVLLVYAPFLNYAFGTLPFAPEAWFLGAPFALLIWAYDECRKYHFRTYGKETWFYEWFFF